MLTFFRPGISLTALVLSFGIYALADGVIMTWMAIAERGQSRDIEVELKPLLDGLSSVVDQSDARAVVRISGPRARDVLAKGVPIDLHPRAFKGNGVAITHANHVGIILWQIDDAPTYEIAMFRGFADSFAHWLLESAEEFTHQR